MAATKYILSIANSTISERKTGKAGSDKCLLFLVLCVDKLGLGGARRPVDVCSARTGAEAESQIPNKGLSL